MRTRDIMATPAVCVRPSATLGEVAAILAENGFTAAPVVTEGDRLVGLVSEADLIRERFGLHPLTGRGGIRKPRSTAGEVMTRPVECISPDATLTALAKSMITAHRRSMPVVEGDRVVGMVARRDLVEVLSRSDEAILACVYDGLSRLGLSNHWLVRVQAGVVHLWSEDDAEHAELVQAVESVAGVLRVTVSGPRRSSGSHRVGIARAHR